MKAAKASGKLPKPKGNPQISQKVTDVKVNETVHHFLSSLTVIIT